MDSLQSLFDQFLRERQYLKNVTPKTIVWYETAFQSFNRTIRVESPVAFDKAALQRFVVASRQRGLSAVSCNTYVKALNAFLAWMHSEGHVSRTGVLPLLRTERRVVEILSTDQLRRLIAVKPKSISHWRAYVLACTLLDTGIRIDECLGLRHTDVDSANLLLKVRGKGRKERIVPFSFELRRTLFRWSQIAERHRWQLELLFPTRRGTRMGQRNALRAHYLLLKRAGIPQCGFHRVRHTFATNYLQNGGDVVRLSRVLGHSQITTTMRYLHLIVSDLQKPHQQLSILNRLHA
jgi:integrase/recombinase XerD